MAPDGSQWAYSQSQGDWLNVGTPYNLNPTAPAIAAASTSAPPASTSITVAPATPTDTTAPPTSYQDLIDFATSSSLVGFIPNWLLGVGIFLGFKVIENKQAAGGRR